MSNAQSAVRNLNDYDVGNRTLRVDFAESDKGEKKAQAATVARIGALQAQAQSQGQSQQLPLPPPPPMNYQPPGPASLPPPRQPQVNNGVPPLPPGTLPSAGITAADAISRTLQVFPPMQLLDIIAQFKSLVLSNPEQAENLLTQSPQLAYAVLQALLLMNLVDANVLTKVVSNASNATSAQIQPPMTQQQPVMVQQVSTPLPIQFGDPRIQYSPSTSQQQISDPRLQQQPPPPAAPQAPLAPLTRPAMVPVTAPSPSPTPQDPQRVRSFSRGERSTDVQAALIQQVMGLSDEQISSFGPEQRAQILQIKQAIQAGTM